MCNATGEADWNDEDRTRMFVPEELTGLPAADDRVHFLLVIEGAEAGRRVEVTERPLTLGRHASADLCLTDGKVSKQHCRVGMAFAQLMVTDLGSTNGTFIDGKRLEGTAALPVESNLRVGTHVLRHEFRSRRDVEQSTQLEGDLKKARAYVEALIPAPLTEGPVRTEWCFIPSAVLGGDAFGYHEIDGDRLCLYLLDVCGHGAGAAMHSVSVINLLRGRALPGADFTRPAEVLAALNRAFQMDAHGGMYFTLWYGVYDRRVRRLAYGSAGHPPAFLAEPNGGPLTDLQTRALPIGTFPETPFRQASALVAPGSKLYLFSDGVYEIVTADGKDGTLAGFRDLVAAGGGNGAGEADRLRRGVLGRSGSAKLEDDFSLLVVDFN